MLAAAFSSEAGASDRGAATEKAAQARVVIIESEGKYIFEEGRAGKNECEVERLLGEAHTKQEIAGCWCVLVFGDLLIYNIFAQ